MGDTSIDARSQRVDTAADELVQNSALPRLEDSDKSVAFDNATLALTNAMSLTASSASVASIFDGAEGEAYDGVRAKSKALATFMKKTVKAWNELSTQERTEDNAEAREKCDDDTMLVLGKTRKFCLEAMHAAVDPQVPEGVGLRFRHL